MKNLIYENNAFDEIRRKLKKLNSRSNLNLAMIFILVSLLMVAIAMLIWRHKCYDDGCCCCDDDFDEDFDNEFEDEDEDGELSGEI